MYAEAPSLSLYVSIYNQKKMVICEMYTLSKTYNVLCVSFKRHIMQRMWVWWLLMRYGGGNGEWQSMFVCAIFSPKGKNEETTILMLFFRPVMITNKPICAWFFDILLLWLSSLTISFGDGSGGGGVIQLSLWHACMYAKAYVWYI